MTEEQIPPTAAVLRILTGAWMAQAVAALAQIGLADAVAAGPRPVGELAADLGVNADALRRVVRATETAGVFRLVPGDRIEQTPVSDSLRTDYPGSVRGVAEFFHHEDHLDAWAGFGFSLRTGRPAFDHVHGAGFFERCRTHPDLGRAFDGAMTSYSHGQHALAVGCYDFSGVRTLVDVGGGHGGLLVEVLRRNPGVRGVLVDQPHVVEGAAAVLDAAGVRDRVQVVGGDFFESVPPGGDAYALGHIVHDWGDDKAHQILSAVRLAARPGAKLLLFESVMPEDARPCPVKLLDLEMLTMTHGGRERTRTEYASLVALAGFRLERVIAVSGEAGIVECVAV